ncbi:extensin family protein [Ancylobacter koreensis]|uniref:extensin-like domain-containing protein n=1 Tax=Ancylobacter koreensis TaxID=266121 RepID=UPI00248C39E4|nr:extensin family protein [Ancylobacter koreensis]
MTRGVSWFLVAPLVLLGLSGCKFGLEQREPWRSEAEERCLAEGRVKPSAFIVQDRALDGPGTCGMDHAFRITAFAEGSVEVAPRATLACPMTSAVDQWLSHDVQGAAMAWFGQPVVKVKQMSSYSCRRMNGAATGKTSEHAYGNGLDIGAFILADGREISVKKDWKGAADARGFLRTVQADACERFTVVLAPGSNIYHYDHIHIDLMRRASGSTTCKPRAERPVPPRLPVYKAPPYKAPYGGGWQAGPMSASPESETGGDAAEGFDGDYGAGPEASAQVYGAPPGRGAPVYGTPPAAPARPVEARMAPANPYPAPSRAPAPAYPAGGAPMVLSPPPDTYGVTAPGYPAQSYPAQSYPAPGYPAQGYPAQGYPAQAAPSTYPAPGAYPAASDYPAPASPYPANRYPAAPYPAAAPAPVPPAGRKNPPGLLPPASVPLAKWLGLDPTPTGSTGNVRSFTTEREFASPIPAPGERLRRD